MAVLALVPFLPNLPALARERRLDHLHIAERALDGVHDTVPDSLELHVSQRFGQRRKVANVSDDIAGRRIDDALFGCQRGRRSIRVVNVPTAGAGRLIVVDAE